MGITTTVSYQEEHGSPKERYFLNHFEAESVYRMAWSDRVQFIEDAAVGTYPHNELGAFPITLDPEPAPGQQKGTGQKASYEDALVRITWSNELTATGEEFQAAAEFLTVNPRAPELDLRWGSQIGDKVSAEEAPGFLIKSLDYTLVRRNLQVIPNTAFTLIGHVNQDQLTALSVVTSAGNLEFFPGTLLYSHPAFSRTQVSVGGAVLWDLTYRFQWRQSGWNNFWNARDQAFSQMVRGTDGTPFLPYPSAAMAWVF